MRKFDPKKDCWLIKDFPPSYVSTEAFIDHFGYVFERDGKIDIVTQDTVFPNTFPYIYLPKNKDQWHNAHILWVSDEELDMLRQRVAIIQDIPIGKELFYQTDDFISLLGSKWGSFRRHVNQFKNGYKFVVRKNAAEKEVEDFIDNWVKRKEVKHQKTEASDLDFFRFCLKNRKRHKIKTVFVFENKKLIGVAMGVRFNEDYWIGLHLKSDYRYKGLSRFLHQERAKLFADCRYFSLGGEVLREPGIRQFKHELNPTKGVNHHYVITGDKLGKA